MCAEYCYINHVRESIRLNENVYKAGRTKQEVGKRLQSYPKGTIQKICKQVSDCVACEKEILFAFDKKFKQRCDLGREYYEGDYNDMEKEFLNIAARFDALKSDTTNKKHVEYDNTNLQSDDAVVFYPRDVINDLIDVSDDILKIHGTDTDMSHYCDKNCAYLRRMIKKLEITNKSAYYEIMTRICNIKRRFMTIIAVQDIYSYISRISDKTADIMKEVSALKKTQFISSVFRNSCKIQTYGCMCKIGYICEDCTFYYDECTKIIEYIDEAYKVFLKADHPEGTFINFLKKNKNNGQYVVLNKTIIDNLYKKICQKVNIIIFPENNGYSGFLKSDRYGSRFIYENIDIDHDETISGFLEELIESRDIANIIWSNHFNLIKLFDCNIDKHAKQCDETCHPFASCNFLAHYDIFKKLDDSNLITHIHEALIKYISKIDNKKNIYVSHEKCISMKKLKKEISCMTKYLKSIDYSVHPLFFVKEYNFIANGCCVDFKNKKILDCNHGYYCSIHLIQPRHDMNDRFKPISNWKEYEKIIQGILDHKSYITFYALCHSIFVESKNITVYLCDAYLSGLVNWLAVKTQYSCIYITNDTDFKQNELRLKHGKALVIIRENVVNYKLLIQLKKYNEINIIVTTFSNILKIPTDAQIVKRGKYSYLQNYDKTGKSFVDLNSNQYDFGIEDFFEGNMPMFMNWIMQTDFFMQKSE